MPQPVLRHERTPAAFNAMLAKDPVLFTRLVALTSYSDGDLDDTNDSDDHGEGIDDDVEGEVKDDADHDDLDQERGGGHVDSSWRFPDTTENRENAFEILREWRLPPPHLSRRTAARNSGAAELGRPLPSRTRNASANPPWSTTDRPRTVRTGLRPRRNLALRSSSRRPRARERHRDRDGSLARTGEQPGRDVKRSVQRRTARTRPRSQVQGVGRPGSRHLASRRGASRLNRESYRAEARQQDGSADELGDR